MMLSQIYLWSIYSNLWKRELATFLLGVSNLLITYFLLDFKQHLKICVLTSLIVISFSLLLFISHKYLKVLLTIVHMISLYFLILNVYQPPVYLVEYEFLSPKNGSMYKYSMFFLESNQWRRELTTKQMCVIEAAAKMNPRALIQLYTISAKLNKKAANKLLMKYPNLRLINFDPDKVFSDTPFFSWWNDVVVKKLGLKFSHLRDAFKLEIYFL